MTKKTKKETQRVNLFLTPGLVQKARAQALKEKKSLSELIDTALESYLPSVITIDGGSKEMEIEFIGSEENDKPRRKPKRSKR